MGIGSILGTLGGLVAAPFTGGMSMVPTMMGAGGAIGGLADIFGGASKAGNDENNKQDSLKLLLENAKLNRDKFALDAPGTRLGTSLRASMASNFKPATLNWGPDGFKPGAIADGTAQMPHWEGGAAGAMANMSPDTKALAQQVMHDELVSQMRGGETGGGTGAKQGDGSMLNPNFKVDGTGTDKAMPTGIGESSTGDNILGGLGMGTSLLSTILSRLKGMSGGGGMYGVGGNGTSYSPGDDNGVG